MSAKNPPVDPAQSPAFALAGRVVTMDKDRTVIDNGVVYAVNGSIAAVSPVGAAPPAGFPPVKVVASGGTIYPGLIELHNHLPYDVLPLWKVPKKYADRDRWSDTGSNPDYHRLITGPMQAIGSDPALVAAIVRYVEVRCLLGGTTTSQGVTLAKSKVSVTHFRGLVRNVENTGDKALPPARTHIADVVAEDAQKFLAAISKHRKYILHLAEGTDPHAHDAFNALDLGQAGWAITNNVIGIHCVALTDDDFAVFAAHGGSMVWSPLSNLLLYGATANVGAARKHKVPIALGSDWAPSGSKNLLGEMKVARLARAAASVPDLRDDEIVAMATITPATMLGWGDALGSLEATKRADLIVVPGTQSDPYTALIDATEADLRLVMISGVPRAGTAGLIHSLGYADGLEPIRVGGRDRVLNLVQKGADQDVELVSAGTAIARLRLALGSLDATPMTKAAVDRRAARPRGSIRLAIEGLVDNKQSPTPHLRYRGVMTGPNLPHTRTLSFALAAAAAAGPLPPVELDPLTAIDNPAYYDLLALENNLPPDVAAGLAALKPGRG